MIPIFILAIENEDDREFMIWLYTQYRALLYAEIKDIVQNKWDVEDILQTVMVNLIDKIPRLRAMDPKGRITYLIITARHTAYSFRQKKKPFLFQISEQDIANGEPALEDDLIKREDLFRLAQIWNDLDDKTRYLLFAKYILDKSGKEIARELNIPPDSIRMAIVRARRKAYQAMQE